ncbi:LCP family glycopolymer transferase [Guptibacillus hwajinpoensis]|uniref:Polyisoprenyl-teichoic acid--peptidoglycan teichoic acid transferase TagU n=1 Tax=Guptibacillus hwajinpoensis TaxID=208199 RepID=A0ABU0K1Q7_9BACL|nr:LytR family transcriptional regulator [Alkalihalobacillus hemicentroti]MDQ0482426.1 LCP family protein required for cell wall assembly [Alkalihalobacillus hemicentroti]
MKKFFIVFGVIVGVLLLAGGGYAYYLYDSVKDTAGDMHEPINRETSEKRTEKLNMQEKDPVSILLMGVDERSNDQGRSDTMIMITLNPNENSMYMFNIPRDTRTEIIGRGTIEKMNHAYAYGGVEMTMDTVENFLDVPIDYYFKVNMEAFKDVVSALNGVTVDNPYAFDYEGYSFPAGEIDLDAQEALAFSRMRYEDPKGDMGRNDRQREIIKSIIDEGASVGSINKIGDLLQAVGSNVKTNMTFEEMNDIFQNYRDARKNMTTFEVQGRGEMIDNLWYYIVSDEEKQSITQKLKNHLEIS